jgi:hypothetical protein
MCATWLAGTAFPSLAHFRQLGSSTSLCLLMVFQIGDLYQARHGCSVFCRVCSRSARTMLDRSMKTITYSFWISESEADVPKISWLLKARYRSQPRAFVSRELPSRLQLETAMFLHRDRSALSKALATSANSGLAESCKARFLGWLTMMSWPRTSTDKSISCCSKSS